MDMTRGGFFCSILNPGFLISRKKNDFDPSKNCRVRSLTGSYFGFYLKFVNLCVLFEVFCYII